MNTHLIYSDFKDFANLDFLIVIPSKNRAELVSNNTAKLFPNESVLFVHQDEVDEYRKYNPEMPIVTHTKTRGYGSVINDILNRTKKDGLKYVMIIDDDMDAVYSLVGNRQRKFDLGKRYEAVVNACQVLSDIDANFYLFSTSSNIVKYQQHKPFQVGFSLPQGVYVIDVRNFDIRFTEGYHYYEDFDFSMQYILKYRFFIIEQRILMTGSNKDALTSGGSNDFRTSKNEQDSREWLKRKWKSHVKFVKNSGGNIRPTFAGSRVAKQ